MLTAKGEESDIVTGLELGADDYITKPFSGKVLVARVRRILRRMVTAADDKAVLKVQDLTIDPSRREVLIEGKPVQLTFTEFNILHILAKRPGLVFTRYQIVDAIRGSDYLVTDRAVDVQIVSLRKKLGRYGEYIETVRGVGYRFKD
jgi:two-component system phosphate regulon response regulator PhoB